VLDCSSRGFSAEATAKDVDVSGAPFVSSGTTCMRSSDVASRSEIFAVPKAQTDANSGTVEDPLALRQSSLASEGKLLHTAIRVLAGFVP
jgi:hypothetical protein